MQSSNVPKTYEDFQPHVETEETEDTLLLLVHVPGFAKQDVGAHLEAASKRITVLGERQIENNRWKHFSVKYQIPESCYTEGLKGKFDEGGIVTISMKKKPVASKEEEPEPAQDQEASKQEDEPGKAVAKDKEGISQEPPKSTMESQRDSDEKEGEAKAPQEDKEGIPEKDDEKEKVEKMKTEAKQPSIPAKATEESKTLEKDQETIPQKGPKDEEKQRDEKEHTKRQENGKTWEASKEPQMELSRKEPDVSAAKSPQKERQEMEAKRGEVGRGEPASEPSVVRGLKEVANSASQTVTRLARRFNEEDRQKLIYVGAAILAVAVGVYASFKIRSSARQ